MEETALARYAIVEDDPLSASVEVDVRCELSRGEGWVTRAHAWGRMTATRDAFVVTTTLDCYEGSSRAFARAWSFTIPRDHC